MSKLTKLRAKRRKRVQSRKHHYAEYKRHKAKKRWARTKWQRVRFFRDVKAIKKLDRLIKKAAREQRIDWNGCEALTSKPLCRAIRHALATADGLYITSTTGGTHSPGSYHYQDRAADFGSNGPGESPEIEAQEALLREFGAGYFAELFGPAGWYVKNGTVYSGTFPAHHDHLHVAV